MTTPRRRHKPRTIHLRFRKNDPGHNLLAAVQHWVKAHGGRVDVIGSIELQDWHEGSYAFRVAVRCIGARPEIGNREKGQR